VEAVATVPLVATDLFAGGKAGLGHLSHAHFHPSAVVLGPALAPGHDLVSASALQGGHGRARLHVDTPGVVTVPRAAGVCIKAKGSTELAGATATAPCTRPAQHGACGETVARGACSPRATAQAFLAHAGGETLGPRALLAAGWTRFPGPMPAIGARKTPQRPPHHDGALQEREGTDAPRAALLHAGTACPTLGTHAGGVAACERQRTLLGAESLMDDAACWETEPHFETMAVHAHGFLLLAVRLSSMLRRILCLSMSDSQPLPIDRRCWPQTWRRAYCQSFSARVPHFQCQCLWGRPISPGRGTPALFSTQESE
jgi:hypothetical protein